MSTPKISVIMPVYNMAEYLDEVLLSWTQQSLPDIEIICIDDCSTDNSLSILNKWAEKDRRITLHKFDRNMSAWTARKWGIEHAAADYVLFADSDDTMECHACEELYEEMTLSPVDILHFDANIINVNGLPEARIRNMRKFVAPYNGTLENEDIFTGCFEKKLYQFSMWNKLFSAKVCRQAVQNTKDMNLPKAQDKLLYWAISLHARSYRGLPGKKYYNYHFGRGGTGFNKLNLKQFERYCSMADTANAMHDYLEERGLLNRYKEIEQNSREALLNDCMTRFRNELDDGQRGPAFDLMLSKWGSAEVIAALAKAEWSNRYKFARCLINSQALKSKNNSSPKTIGTYYHSCANGGAQRVMCDLSNLLASMGYNIVIFTDEEANENDYPTPANAKRVVLPHHQHTNKRNYIERVRVWEAAIKNYSIDVMIYHAWVLNMMFWDELVCKANGVAFIGHCHNVFSLPILKGHDSINYIAPYVLADGMVTLSKTDQYYWQHFNSNVHVTINPFSEGFDNWHTSGKLDEKQILWLGRLSKEKRPEDALVIIKSVIAREPEAHLHIVGNNPSEEYMENFRNKIKDMGLSEHVTLHGFHPKVQDFYQNASVFLMTSEYEGYPLTLQESKLAGLPCVMYELPYLSLCEGNRGIVPVEANNTQAAADAILDLLRDDNKRHAYAKEARAHIEELCQFDFVQKWEDIISSVYQSHNTSVPDASRNMVDTLLNHHLVSINQRKHPLRLKRTARIKCTNLQEKEIDENVADVDLTRHRFLRKIQGGIQCCIDHGVAYTIKYFFVKLFRKITGK